MKTIERTLDIEMNSVAATPSSYKSDSRLAYMKKNPCGCGCLGCGCLTGLASPFVVYGLYHVGAYVLQIFK